MHYPPRSKLRFMPLLSLTLLGGIGLIYGLHNQAVSQTGVIPKPTPTTVVAQAKPSRPKPKTVPLHPIVANASVDQYLKAHRFSGTALIVRNGRTILRQAYGERDRQRHLANQIDTPYYVGSTQKALIATAILQLQDRGKLRVNDALATYLPNFPNGGQITLKHLLNHTSGIRGHAATEQPMTPTELVAQIAQAGIREQPGR
ncbi:hypothetical protein LAPL110952_08015 [Lactiplantibacillus plajomi]